VVRTADVSLPPDPRRILSPIFIILWLFRSPFGSNLWVWLAMLCYGVSKIAEAADLPVYEALGISGHSIKHVLAALGVLALYMALSRRHIRT
jgi:hypothetical protein